MYPFPIGVMLNSFKTDFEQALKKASKMGLEGIQIYATPGEMSPEYLTLDKRKELLNKVKAQGLTISALCGDLGVGFGDATKNVVNIEKSKRIIELAKDLETNIVTTHIGVIPNDTHHERYKIMQEACFELGRYAEQLQAYFAVETGPETAHTLKIFLDSLGTKGIAVNLDPANFVMVTGDDPVQAVYTLKDYIVHTHAKDGKRLQIRDPEIIYGIIEDEIQAGKSFVEVPLGQGTVDFREYLKALEEIGYKGFLTIEREVGHEPEKDIQLAVEFLKKMIRG